MSGSGSEYADGNVIRPKAFEGGGFTDSTGAGGGGGDDGMLAARVAELDADIAHIQRDLTAVQADLKTILATVSDIRSSNATLVERTGHLATREWVGLRLFAAGTIIVVLLAGAVGFAPKLQGLLGTATTSAAAPPR